MDGRAGGEALTAWQLPQSVIFGGRTYHFHADFRNILRIFSYWEDPDLPAFLKWHIALRLFYKERLAERDAPAAMEYLAGFVAGFQPQKAFGGKLLVSHGINQRNLNPAVVQRPAHTLDIAVLLQQFHSVNLAGTVRGCVRG